MRSKYFIFLLSLTSCATIKNKRTCIFNVTTCEDSTKIIYNDSTYNLPLKMELKRSRKPLIFSAVRDSVNRAYIINPITDNHFRFGNMYFFIYPPGNPLGYLADLTNPQRYYYGKELSVDAKNEDTILIHPKGHVKGTPYLTSATPKQRTPYFSKDLAQKGTYFTLSVPIADHMQLQPYGEGMKESWGGFGFSLGLEHYYEKNKAMGIRMGLMVHNTFPTLGERFGDYYAPKDHENAFSVYLTAFKKYHVNREAFSFGINNVTNWWRHDQSWRDPVDSNLYHTRNRDWTTNSFGFELAAYHYFNSVIQLGIIYRPTILTVTPDVRLMYQHTISLDVAFRFNTQKEKKEVKKRRYKPMRDTGTELVPVKIEKLSR